MDIVVFYKVDGAKIEIQVDPKNIWGTHILGRNTRCIRKK